MLLRGQNKIFLRVDCLELDDTHLNATLPQSMARRIR